MLSRSNHRAIKLQCIFICCLCSCRGHWICSDGLHMPFKCLCLKISWFSIYALFNIYTYNISLSGFYHIGTLWALQRKWSPFSMGRMIKVPWMGQTLEFSASSENSDSHTLQGQIIHGSSKAPLSALFYVLSVHQHFAGVLQWVRNYSCLYSTHLQPHVLDRRQRRSEKDGVFSLIFHVISVGILLSSTTDNSEITPSLTIYHMCFNRYIVYEFWKVEVALSRFYLGEYFPFLKWLSISASQGLCMVLTTIILPSIGIPLNWDSWEKFIKLIG